MASEIRRNIYLYRVQVKHPRPLDPTTICNQFLEKNLTDNLIKLDDHEYLLISFKQDSDLVGATFCKSKDLSPLIYGKKKGGFLKRLLFGEDEELGEPSLLIWDLKNNIMISEMNWDGARHISTYMGKYLSQILGLEVTIQPIFHAEAYKEVFLKNKVIKKLSLEVPKPHINLVSDIMGADVKDIDKYVKDEGDLSIKITISCTQHKKGLDPAKILEAVKKLSPFKREESEIKFYAQDSNQVILPLLDDALLRHPMEFTLDSQTKSINRESFFSTVKRFWELNSSDILKLLD